MTRLYHINEETPDTVGKMWSKREKQAKQEMQEDVREKMVCKISTKNEKNTIGK